jgi:hypothetical protein
MDVKEYIASGVVELYAMNALSSNEKKDFERNMLLYPELNEELKNISIALERYADDHAVNPHPQLRLKLVKQNGHYKEIKQAKDEKSPKKNTSVLGYKYLIAASLAALVISTFASWFFYSRWEDAEDRYTDLLNDKNELAESYNLVKLTFDENLTKLFVMRDPSTKMFEMHAADTSGHYMARVYWNKLNRRTYVDMIKVPDPGEGRQYQLWAVNAGNKTDAGICSADGSGLQQVKDIEEANGWILSIEQKGIQATAPTVSLLMSN